YEGALRLAGAAAALRAAMGAPLPPPARVRHETALAPARRALLPGAGAAATAAGRALPPQQAIAAALAAAAAAGAGGGRGRRRRPRRTARAPAPFPRRRGGARRRHTSPRDRPA